VRQLTCVPEADASPEAVLALRSVSTFESLYLSRSTSRMSDAVSSAMSHYSVPRGTAPSATEGVNIARAITNELDSARFDPLLVRTVARNAVKVLNTLKTRIDGAVSVKPQLVYPVAKLTPSSSATLLPPPSSVQQQPLPRSSTRSS
jgi:hypothetical protein